MGLPSWVFLLCMVAWTAVAQTVATVPVSGTQMSGALALAAGSTAPTPATADNSTTIPTTAWARLWGAATYLPLTGGSLTGALTGTTLSMSGNITSTNGNVALYAGKSLAFSSNTTAQYWYCTAATCNGQGNWTQSGAWTIQGALQSQAGLVSIQAASAGYTLAATDCGTTVWDTGASAAHTITIPSGLPIRCRITVTQATTNTITLTNASGEVIGFYSPTSNSSTTSTTTAGSLSIALSGQWDSRVIEAKTSTLAVVSAGQ